MRHYALRDIAAGEEITLNYGAENAKHFLEKD
jgi:SET domain-containing protein